MLRHTLLALLAVALLAPTARAQGAAEPPRGAAALAQAADALSMTARVLVVGAHPDDEDTRLIAYLARGRHAETAYLSLTRGDGGQNLIGNELGEALGAIRTEELLAARRLDGGRQYFARAFDFGFSKSAEETFRHWPRDTVLGDVVRVVRAFRPHVMIAIFSGTRADGHGHHEASGILAREAYDAAADTLRFPARAFGPAWSPSKFYRNTSYRGAETATLRYNAGAYDPVLGRSYAELAAISRTQHKSQGQGGAERKGVSVVSMRREGARANVGGAPNAERDLFDGIDTTVRRVRAALGCARAQAALDSLPGALAAARAAMDLRRPEGALPALARARRLAARAQQPYPSDVVPSECETTDGDAAVTLGAVRDRVEAAALLAAGVGYEENADRELVAAGDSVQITRTLYNRGRDTVRVLGFRPGRPGGGGLVEFTDTTVVAPDSVYRRTRWWRAAADPTESAITRPWWLASPRRGDLFDYSGFRYADPFWWALSDEDDTQRHAGGQPSAWVDLDVGGVRATPLTRVARRAVDPVAGEVVRPLAVVPAISVTLDRAVQYARAGVPLDRVLRVSVSAADTTARAVTVRLTLPSGLTADSVARTVALGGAELRATVAFRLRGALPPGRHTIRAVAESGGQRFASGYQLVDYAHIRPQRLYRPAEVALEAVDVALPPRARVAYVPGVSDNVAPALADLGLDVTVLDGAALGAADLSRFTHVVVGPRAYEANDALQANNARLLAWTAAGGTMLVQYGQYEMMRPGVMPYPITLGRPAQRVTIEEAPVAPLGAPRLLASPNRLTAADWQGWVQERSTYMPTTADPAYRTVVALNDPGEPPNPNGILVAPVGRGTYVYVTLALFRQLPAGVPGAARLVANLLAAGASGAPRPAARP